MSDARDLPVSRLVQKLHPGYEEPHHLSPLIDHLERAITDGGVRLCVSTPPQHGKTVTNLAGLVKLMAAKPSLRHAYCTYNAGKAAEESDSCKALAHAMGLEPVGTKSLWSIRGGGKVAFVGVGEGLAGRPVDGLLLVDDPHKDHVEAFSPAMRKRANDWFLSVAHARLHPGASAIIVQTRWTVDDLYGTMAKQEGWEAVNLPAIDDEGRPLWPSRRPLSYLEPIRTTLGGPNGLFWLALYQGAPRRRGGNVFDQVYTYDRLPDRVGLRFALGVDLAYSMSTRANWSVIVSLAADRDGTEHVLQVWRRQERAEEFLVHLCSARRMYPTAEMRWYGSSTEAPLADTLNPLAQHEHGVRLKLRWLRASADKLVRATSAAAAWNAGRILVPRDAPWLEAFTSEVLDFAGLGEQDDQVDALAAAHDALAVHSGKGRAAVLGGGGRFERTAMLG